ncbi:hypothetical protein F5B22DRAFT_526976 [Xylaria bambusicola]|uniref:uncharacterized protein n=1 Tax=Xylaria bambusicola TaxID=326684 RepID=UPI00200815EC|nr:uncharacterized protein F5B22DRAFT_526976 [Xylaria bambusicola]KAI0505381.1 hypothetical protein F5B22DRAFT_526976 [Xylaria bambusicola]
MSPGLVEQDEGLGESLLEPVAICGMACRLPGGVDSDSSFWKMLVEKRSGQTPRVPESRFNIDAHYHENLARPGSFNVAGGYFLDGQPEEFDPTFFNMTPIEAQWLDPQQRKMLEVSYECLVSAGITLESIAGSNTAVFVGSFTSDYQQMSTREPDFRHNYAATGVDPGIISNRIGNVFNLNGPSFTINTACSSSIYALHNACHALRNRDCDAAIVGGVNLIITVDQHMNTAKLGILSPTSTCHTFDASADGYGRAEGAGALFVKRLSDAIRDGDPIRGVVRATAVNTNGKVEGMGITHPSAAGQERVVRMAYQKANLDPTLTAYAELHGTGTPVGDPIEVRAISRALNDRRPTDKPLLVGAVKPNIGHSEAASGIFAVMKAALMTEAAIIPGVAYFQNLNPEIKEKDWNVKVHADTAPWPSDYPTRRASVSSFGYGGTNGHVIIDAIESLYPWYQHAQKRRDSQHVRLSKKATLLCFSAHDKPTLLRNITAVGAVAPEYHLSDLAYTLNMRRTKFMHRAYVVARDGHESDSFSKAALQTGSASKKPISIGFLFTGQGAQWAGMGKAACQEFPIMMETIQHLDRILSKAQPKPSFNMTELLLQSSEDSARRINDADIAQPLCTAIQIALVDLFAQWNITPEVSIGHSSGEIGAAYAAGLISAPEAILAAFCRGRSVSEYSPPGSMLAVGLGVHEVEEYLSPFDVEDVCIACENSPSSVTLSGREGPISEVRERLASEKIFARELPTGRAYHSPHMASVGIVYDSMLTNALNEISEDDFLWRRPRSCMISSVTGRIVDSFSESLKPGYWSDNLRNRVLFDTAVQQLGSNKDFESLTHLIEVGPHSALAGPFKQICLHNKYLGSRIKYFPSLKRNENDTDRLLSVAGSLFLEGYNVDLEGVNESNESGIKNDARKQKTKHLIVDLPPYQWNYEKRYWTEPRASAEQRARAYPRHDLLGSRISGLSRKSASWRNVLRHRDVPWLKDHNLGGTAIFPAAGHLSMAIEALQQVCETAGKPFKGVTLRDVDIRTALVVPDDDDGIEVILNLQSPTDPTSDWYHFSVESPGSDGEWTTHCNGRISAIGSPKSILSSNETPVDETALTQRVSGQRWYSAFHRVGFYYGKTFQQLRHARTARTLHHASGDVTIRQIYAEEMQGESRYLIHPTSIDACLQLIIISINSGKHKDMPWGVVPTRLEEVTLFPALTGQESGIGHAVAWTNGFEGRRFNTNVQLSGSDHSLLLDIKNLTCTAYEAALPAVSDVLNGTEAKGSEPFSIMSWKPDVQTLRYDDLEALWPDIPSELDKIGRCVDLISHRQILSRILIIVRDSVASAQALIGSILDTIPDSMSISVVVSVGDDDKTAVMMSELAQPRVQLNTWGANPKNWDMTDAKSHDLVVADSHVQGQEPLCSELLLQLVGEDGWLIYPSEATASLGAVFSLKLGEHTLLHKTEGSAQKLEASSYLDEVTVLSASCDRNLRDFGDTLPRLQSQAQVQEKDISEFTRGQDRRILIDDFSGAISALMLEKEATFEIIKQVLTSGVPVLWLTRGARQGLSVGRHSGAGGIAEGLLRVIRSEQAAAKITILDVDADTKPANVCHAIVHALNSAATKDSGRDTELWLHRGIIHTSRIYSRDVLNRDFSQVQPQKTPLSGSLRLTTKTEDGRFVFEFKDQKLATLRDEQVEIQVLASNWPSFSAGSRMLVAGNIIGVGSSVAENLIGKRAIAFTYDTLQTVLTTSAYAVVSEELFHLSPEQLVHTALPLYPFVNLCLSSAKLEKGDTVISLPGHEQSIKMLTRLANIMGWRFSVVNNTDNANTVNALISSQRESAPSRAVTIIAHDFDTHLAQEVWRGIPPSCRLLVLNEQPLETTLDPLPFSRGASFIPSSMKYLRESTTAASSLLATSLNLIEAHPSLRMEMSDSDTHCVDIEDTMYTSKHQGKELDGPEVVVCYRPQTSRIWAIPKRKQLRLSPDATYLLVGCLGGLGRSLTRWMMAHGAKHFTFISRSGIDKPEAARLVKHIELSGASTRVERADASDQDKIARIVASIQAERPIRGVVHAAMVLKDGMFEQMTHQSFYDCIRPKAQGALSLHSALESAGIDPEFFVMTSSISALLGNTGQANYSAANSALDSLARQRRAAGLAATSLVLPMVLDVGVVADNDSIEASLVRKGLYGIDEHEMLRGFEAAMLMSRSSSDTRKDSSTSKSVITTNVIADESQIIMGMEPRELAASAVDENTAAYWHEDSRFRHTRAAMERLLAGTGTSNNSKDSESNSFTGAIKVAASESPEAVVQVVSEHIARRMSSILMIPFDNFELTGQASIASYGLDSMIGAELRTWLFKEFGLDYPFQKLLASTLTFKSLADVVIDTIGVLNEVPQPSN